MEGGRERGTVLMPCLRHKALLQWKFMTSQTEQLEDDPVYQKAAPYDDDNDDDTLPLVAKDIGVLRL